MLKLYLTDEKTCRWKIREILDRFQPRESECNFLYKQSWGNYVWFLFRPQCLENVDIQVCVKCSWISLIFFFSKSDLWDSVRLLKEAVVNFSILGKIHSKPLHILLLSVISVYSCCVCLVNSGWTLLALEVEGAGECGGSRAVLREGLMTPPVCNIGVQWLAWFSHCKKWL